ncbi:MAG: hypothetical protein JWL83_4463 [Actinomycetia bacterium]|nr:hypothetical protein [Actinomycetes bacterium]
MLDSELLTGNATPFAGESVTIVGFGIAPQQATVEATDGRRLLLRPKSANGLSVGTSLDVQYLRDGDLYTVVGTLESRTGEMWWLVVDDTRRVQRREHLRVQVWTKSTLLLPNPAGGEDACLVDLVDVSAGGCAFLYCGTIVEGTLVELRFRTQGGRVHVRGTVLECRASKRGQHRIRVRFCDVSVPTREQITAWVMMQTRGGL